MLDKKQAAHLAELSKLEFTDEELEKTAIQMNNIVELMDKIKEINRDLPVFTKKAVDYSALRTDEAEQLFERDEILKNAKETKASSFTVPKIV